MIETFARDLLESRWRRLTVIIVTFGLALVAVWPAVDEYFALSGRRAALSEELAEARATAAGLDRLEAQAAENRADLAALEARAASPERLHVFRRKVVELARATGCQVRRVNVGDARRREWRSGDNPLEHAAAPADPKAATGYILRTQPVSLAVSGKLSCARDCLARLASLDVLLHINQFSLQPAGTEGRDVNLEVEALLFDLVRADPAPGAPGPPR